jgi:hypothetical protein
MNKTSGPLSVVTTTGFNFYLTYLYDKQHILFVDRELCYLSHSFLYLSAYFLFDYYCHNYMTSSEVKLNVQRSYNNIKWQMYWIRLLNKYWMMRERIFIPVCTVQYHYLDVERTHDFMISNTPRILWCRTHLAFYDVDHT